MVPAGHKAIPLRAIPVHSAAPRDRTRAERPTTPAPVVRTRTVSTFVLPLRGEGRAGAAVYDIAAPAIDVPAGHARPESTSPFAFPEPQPLAAWQLGAKDPEVTARAGGRYAVGETLADHRRVGPPRSALDAMLVFRIDGNNDSPTLGVGGGVAGAMWKAGVNR
jgi:hypothetical protein